MAIKNSVAPRWCGGRKRFSVRRNGELTFVSLQQQMDQLVDDFFRCRGVGLAPWRAFEENLNAYSPRLDVVENDKEIRISAELPGMHEKDLQVFFSGGVLTMRGEKKVEKENSGKNYCCTQRSCGSFYRRIPISAEVSQDRIDALFKDGVLTITLPKTAKAQQQTKRIAVKAE